MVISLPIFNSNMLDYMSLDNKDICSFRVSNGADIVSMQEYDNTSVKSALYSVPMNVFTSRNINGINGWFGGIDINMKNIFDKIMGSRTCLKKLKSLTNLSAVDFLSLYYDSDYIYSATIAVDMPAKASDIIEEIRNHLLQKRKDGAIVPVYGSLVIWSLFINSVGLYIPSDNITELSLSFNMDLIISNKLTVYKINDSDLPDVEDDQCFIPDEQGTELRTIQIGDTQLQKIVSSYARVVAKSARFHGRVIL